MLNIATSVQAQPLPAPPTAIQACLVNDPAPYLAATFTGSVAFLPFLGSTTLFLAEANALPFHNVSKTSLPSSSDHNHTSRVNMHAFADFTRYVAFLAS